MSENIQQGRRERKRQEARQSHNRIIGWGLRRIRKFWNQKIRNLPGANIEEEKTQASKYEAYKTHEMTEAKREHKRVIRLRGEKNRLSLKHGETARLLRYLKKSYYFYNRLKKRRNYSSEAWKIKMTHHAAEIGRVKNLLYGDIQSLA